jgi:hypothetical protein
MNGPVGDAGLRWQSSAIMALQEATEAFLVHLFEDACVLFVSTLFASLDSQPTPFYLHIQQLVCDSCPTRNNNAKGHTASKENKRRPTLT